MKYLGIVFIVTSCGVVGVSLAEALRRRASTLNNLYCLLNDFSISLQYTAPTVWKLVDNASNNPEFSNIRFLKIFQRERSQGVAFSTLWNTSISKDSSLRSAEKDILYGIGNSLGRVGCKECISNLHLAMDRVKLLHTQALDEYAKKGNLYRWFGILVGIAVSIMVV